MLLSDALKLSSKQLFLIKMILIIQNLCDYFGIGKGQGLERFWGKEEEGKSKAYWYGEGEDTPWDG